MQRILKVELVLDIYQMIEARLQEIHGVGENDQRRLVAAVLTSTVVDEFFVTSAGSVPQERGRILEEPESIEDSLDRLRGK